LGNLFLQNSGIASFVPKNSQIYLPAMEKNQYKPGIITRSRTRNGKLG